MKVASPLCGVKAEDKHSDLGIDIGAIRLRKRRPFASFVSNVITLFDALLPHSSVVMTEFCSDTKTQDNASVIYSSSELLNKLSFVHQQKLSAQVRGLFITSLVSFVVIFLSILLHSLTENGANPRMYWLPVCATSCMNITLLPLLRIFKRNIYTSQYLTLTRLFLCSNLATWILWNFMGTSTESFAIAFSISPCLLFWLAHTLDGSRCTLLFILAHAVIQTIFIIFGINHIGLHTYIWLLSTDSIVQMALESYHMYLIMVVLLLVCVGFKEEQLTQTQQVNMMVIQQIAETERQSLNKQRFLSAVAHDVLSPLHGIISGLSLTLDDPHVSLVPEHRDYLNMSRASASSLLYLFNDFFDITRLDSSSLRFEHVEFDLVETIETVLRSFCVEAHQKGIQLVSDLAFDLPSRVVSDPFRLTQILNNLLSNALKFHKPAVDKNALVVVRCEVVDNIVSNALSAERQSHLLVSSSRHPVTTHEGASITHKHAHPTSHRRNSSHLHNASAQTHPRVLDQKEIYLHLQVQDNGIGIPEDKLGIIFERYQQADNTISESFAGQGLGLAICAGIVKLFGGSIWAESRVHNPINNETSGSTFHVMLILPMAKNNNVQTEVQLAINSASKLNSHRNSLRTYDFNTSSMQLHTAAETGGCKQPKDGVKRHNPTGSLLEPHAFSDASVNAELSWIKWCHTYQNVLVCIEQTQLRTMVEEWVQEWQNNKQALANKKGVSEGLWHPAAPRVIAAESEGQLMNAVSLSLDEMQSPSISQTSSREESQINKKFDESPTAQQTRKNAVRRYAQNTGRVLVIIDDFVDASSASITPQHVAYPTAKRHSHSSRNRRSTKYLRTIQQIVQAKRSQATVDIIWLLSPGSLAITIPPSFQLVGSIISPISRHSLYKILDTRAGIDKVSFHANITQHSISRGFHDPINSLSKGYQGGVANDIVTATYVSSSRSHAVDQLPHIHSATEDNKSQQTVKEHQPSILADEQCANISQDQLLSPQEIHNNASLVSSYDLKVPVIPETFNILRATSAPEPLLAQMVFSSLGSSHSSNASIRSRSNSLDAKLVCQILVVDDSLINRKLAVAVLKRMSLSCLAVESGEKALIVHRESYDPISRRSSFLACLMDIRMQGLNGHETAIAIRKYEREMHLESLPILALTANISSEDEKLAQEAGMQGYLHKPLQTDQLLKEFRKLNVPCSDVKKSSVRNHQ